MSGRLILRLVRWVSLALPLAAAISGADESLEKRATWQQPSQEDVRSAIDSWLEERAADELTQARVDTLWAPESAEAFHGDRLDRLATTIAMVHPEATAVLELCGSTQRPLVVPEFDILDQQDAAPLVRNNLRLYLARWLAQQNLYDESLTLIADLKPEDVVDPAALLFYQAAGHHRMLDKDQCLPVVARLLENKGSLPRRYETMAMLMESDIKPLKTDSLDEISRMMDDIERRLGFGRAGTRVRKEEDDVIAKLDKMIEELEKQMQQAQSASGSAGGQRASQPMQDSMPGGGSGPGDVEQRRTGSRAGWGNLPPKQRQEALQQIAKGLPSHYREVIEEYFRKLARDGND
jgi:hypothetical protein